MYILLYQSRNLCGMLKGCSGQNPTIKVIQFLSGGFLILAMCGHTIPVVSRLSCFFPYFYFLIFVFFCLFLMAAVISLSLLFLFISETIDVSRQSSIRTSSHLSSFVDTMLFL